MDNEAFKFPEKSDLKHPSTFQPANVHPLPESHPPFTTMFSRFVQKVGLIFFRTRETTDLKLIGRIRELKNFAHHVLFELLEVKKELKEKIDPALFSIVTMILDPLIKETGRDPPIVEKKDSRAHQVKIFGRYVESIEKAKEWIEIGKMNANRESLEQVIIQQAAKEFLLKIDRDIQVVQDYFRNALGPLGMPGLLESEIKDRLIPGLNQNILKLNELKILPNQFTLSSFIEWCDNSDKARELLFSSSLHIIDEFSEEFLPSPKSENEGEDFQVITETLDRLEEKIDKAALDIKCAGKIERNQRKVALVFLDKLEAEVHALNSNLYLSQEHSERIEGFFGRLLALRKYSS